MKMNHFNHDAVFDLDSSVEPVQNHGVDAIISTNWKANANFSGIKAVEETTIILKRSLHVETYVISENVQF